jgi:membrane associated rhomboid family serine protease
MKRLGQQFLDSLTPGVRILLAMLTTAALVTFIGQLTRAVDLNRWLALTAQSFWHGQLWRIVTYALLPAGILNFIFNAVALVMLGGRVERVRTRVEMWIICIVSTTGAGLAEVLLPFSSSIPLAGGGPMMFGLLAAWCFACGHERISLIPSREITVRQLALVFVGVSFFVMVFTAGWRSAAVMAAGGFNGWLYVWLWHKWLMSRAGRVAPSDRISRLEL